jgi:hypothetical protein
MSDATQTARRAVGLPTLLAGALAGALAAAAAGRGGEAAGSLETCLATAADYSPVYPTRTFPAGTTEVAAALRLAAGESYPTMTATWVVVEVADPPTRDRAIHRTAMTLQGRDRAAIRLRNADRPFPAGRYRLDVSAGDRLWQSVGFEVAPATSGAAPGAGPAMPIARGTTWRYAFEQVAAPGVKLTPAPGLVPDSAGRLRATVTRRVAASDARGIRVEVRRNDALVGEEWWRLDDAGLAITQRREGGETVPFDPPVVLWPWPPAPKSWEYPETERSRGQAFRAWGPVHVKGPAGDGPGSVVLTAEQQANPPIATTIERHYLPGVGLVREVTVQALNGRLMTRQEMVLTEGPVQ